MCSQLCSHVMEIGSVRFWFRRGDISITCKDGSSPSCETVLVAFNKRKGELVPHVFDNVAKATVTIDAVPCNPEGDCSFSFCWSSPSDVPHSIRFSS